MKTIGIVGLGFVGNAIQKFFQKTRRFFDCRLDNSAYVLTEQSECTNQLIVYDKYRDGGIGDIRDILVTDMVFLCLPTPYNETSRSYDIEALQETCQFLNDNAYNGLVIIKSTVLPTTCQCLADISNLSIIHNPEFLTARTAERDFATQQHIVLGSTSNVTERQLNSLKEFYHDYFPNAEISVTVSGQSEAMKIFCNSFYATKIQVFNEFYLLCQELGLNYNETRDLMLKNGWINPMHTNVPGPDGKLSFGGLCFTKDLSALISQMENYRIPHKVLNATLNERNLFRKD